MSSTPTTLDAQALAQILCDQDGVISRQQVLACGGGHHDVRRKLRRREWARVHKAVYVDHTGPLTWRQRAWAAVLAVAPAALAGPSALRAEAGPGWRGGSDSDPIQVLVARDRHPQAPPGVIVHRADHLDRRVRWNLSPPRATAEDATLDVALRSATVLDLIEALAASVRARRTTPQRLITALADRPHIRRRALVNRLLADLRDGSCSALEYVYLTRVERPHGLPTPERQFRERLGGSTVYRDGTLRAFGVVIELDGAMFHVRSRQHDRDLDRDLDVVVDGRLTIRLGWGQVHDRPCRTAVKVALILQAQGWDGAPIPCGPGCAIANSEAA